MEIKSAVPPESRRLVKRGTFLFAIALAVAFGGIAVSSTPEDTGEQEQARMMSAARESSNYADQAVDPRTSSFSERSTLDRYRGAPAADVTVKPSALVSAIDAMATDTQSTGTSDGDTPTETVSTSTSSAEVTSNETGSGGPVASPDTGESSNQAGSEVTPVGADGSTTDEPDEKMQMLSKFMDDMDSSPATMAMPDNPAPPPPPAPANLAFQTLAGDDDAGARDRVDCPACIINLQTVAATGTSIEVSWNESETHPFLMLFEAAPEAPLTEDIYRESHVIKDGTHTFTNLKPGLVYTIAVGGYPDPASADQSPVLVAVIAVTTEDSCDPAVVNFGLDWLGDRPGHHLSDAIAVDLDCTHYNVRLVSSDKLHKDGYQPEQTGERWRVLGLDAAGQTVYTSPIIDDLPDDQTTMSVDVGEADLTDVVSFQAEHGSDGLFEPNVNSVHPMLELIPLP